MREILQKPVLPIYAAAAAWLVYALFFPLYKIWHFILCAAVTAAVYIVFKKLFPGKKILVAEPESPPDTGNPELNRLIEDGRAKLLELRRLNAAIKDPTITRQLDEMERITQKIFDQVESHPEKLPQVKTFLNYYLPTVLKLLKSYDQLSKQGISGANIENTMRKIENIMETVLDAFRKQLDNLFEDTAMDISADISVLETMIAKEGLKDSRF